MNEVSEKSRIAPLDEPSMALAARLLNDGDLVAVPTETVYGLAADATNGTAVAAIFAAKGRPSFNPLISHVSGVAMAQELGEMNALAERLARDFWPGPLTLVLPKANTCPVHDLALAGLDTIAVRLPDGPMRELAARLDKPIAAPSANLSGRISATSAQAVEKDLGKSVALILDNGPTPVGVESTIIAVDGDTLRLLRPGGVPLETIEEAIGQGVEGRDSQDQVRAPGMLASHYAPDMPVRLNAREVASHEALLSFGSQSIPGQDQAAILIDLSPSGDLAEAAQNLFAAMRTINTHGASAMAVAPIPHTGLGAAINDRLARAAAPKDVGHG
ncbi:MAG: L-threonylcarbamoyladenylate synthase [Pseudomonadota bacterium]